MSAQRFDVYQLANDAETYGGNAGKWIVVTGNGDIEVTHPMSEWDAQSFAALCNALTELVIVADSLGVIRAVPEPEFMTNARAALNRVTLP